MFRHEGAVGPAEPDANLRAASLKNALVPAICSGNDPEAVGMDLAHPKGHRTRCKVLEDCY